MQIFKKNYDLMVDESNLLTEHGQEFHIDQYRLKNGYLDWVRNSNKRERGRHMRRGIALALDYFTNISKVSLRVKMSVRS